MKIGPALKDGREANHLTQEIVSEKLFVTRQTISNWETNRSYPDLDRLVQLCDLYHLSLDDILRGDSDIMEHFKEQEKLSNRTRLIIQVSYWLNIILLIVTLVMTPLHTPFRAIFSVGLMLNIIYLFGTCGGFELKRYSKFEIILIALLSVILMGFLDLKSIMNINYHVTSHASNQAYISGEIVGSLVIYGIVTASILAIWFLRKYAFRK